MLHTIVEGEPGIFPDPVARVMRKIGGWFDRRKPTDPANDPGNEPATDTTPAADTAPRDADPPPGGDGHSGESR